MYYVGAILMTFILVTLYKCLIPKVALKQEAERSSGPARGIRRKKSPAHAKHSDGDGREHIRPAQPSVVSQGVLRDLRLRLSHPWNLSSIALGHLPRPIPPNVSHVLPARFVVPPFGWSGPWHPLFKSGLHSHHNLLDVEIAPKNFRPTAGRLNIKFNVVEPFTIPLIYGKLKNRDEVRKYVRKQESQWYISFTLCPYTAEWVNNMVDTVSRIPVFYPMDSKYVPEKTAKVHILGECGPGFCRLRLLLIPLTVVSSLASAALVDCSLSRPSHAHTQPLFPLIFTSSASFLGPGRSRSGGCCVAAGVVLRFFARERGACHTQPHHIPRSFHWGIRGL